MLETQAALLKRLRPRAAALDLADFGITVNAIALGAD